MEFKILGALEVRGGDGREIRVPAGRERALLALLLIERGTVVSVDRILAALWGERPPGTASKAVQGYVSHLRRLLADGGEDLILTRSPGYLLRADAAVDADRFETLASEGRRRLDEGDHGAAVAALDAALALRRGPPLDDFTFDDFAQDEIRRLDEVRLGAVEDRIDALLGSGRLGGLPAELDALVAAHPLRERLRAQAMTALYRSGRQADALTVYEEGRRLLADELGVDPGPELQRLQRAILNQDPSLGSAPPAPTPPPDAPQPRRRRRRWIAAGGALAVVVAAVVLAIVLTRDSTPAAATVTPPAIVVIDPRTDTVVATVPVGSRPLAVAADEDGVWVGDARDGTVSLVDTATRRVVQTTGIGSPAVDLATGEGSVWVATGGFGEVVRVDAGAGGVTRRIPLGDPASPIVPTVSSVGVGGGHVWAGALGGMVRIDPPSGRVTKLVDLDQSSALSIAAGDDGVWASLLTRRAKRVEAVSAQVTTEFYAGQLVVPVALDGDVVWIAAADDGGLWKLDAESGQTILTTRAGSGANALAVGEGSVWVGTWRSGALIRVNPETGDVLATIPLGGEPFDAVVADGLVWVAVPRRLEDG